MQPKIKYHTYLVCRVQTYTSERSPFWSEILSQCVLQIFTGLVVLLSVFGQSAHLSRMRRTHTTRATKTCGLNFLRITVPLKLRGLPMSSCLYFDVCRYYFRTYGKYIGRDSSFQTVNNLLLVPLKCGCRLRKLSPSSIHKHFLILIKKILVFVTSFFSA